ncbi:MAG: lamin tail domain-containing protein [Candidatus Krumholzibacteria bacterium]|nr:lamin tail domain-containing protein [Candidatus Krumholzibacteria bacterium]
MRTTFRIAAFTAALALTAGMPGTASAQVLISELMPDPARDWDGDGSYDYRNDEWVEIFNAGESAVDLSAYLLRDAGDSWNWRYGFSGVLAPGQALVVYGSDSRVWEESAGLPVYGLSLNNTGDEIRLCRFEGPDTVTVDTVVFGRHAVDDRSLGRIDGPEGWALFDALNPCGDTCDPPGNGCLPTPGAVNSCTTSSARSSWGMIKRIAGS